MKQLFRLRILIATHFKKKNLKKKRDRTEGKIQTIRKREKPSYCEHIEFQGKVPFIVNMSTLG